MGLPGYRAKAAEALPEERIQTECFGAGKPNRR